MHGKHSRTTISARFRRSHSSCMATPLRLKSDAAIVRFVDTMQELNDPIRHHERELYTPEEVEAVRRVNDVVLAHTSKAFGRAIRPWMGPLATMNLFRAIQAIAAATGRKCLRIFELGPGSGYLGALLPKPRATSIGRPTSPGILPVAKSPAARDVIGRFHRRRIAGRLAVSRNRAGRARPVVAFRDDQPSRSAGRGYRGVRPRPGRDASYALRFVAQIAQMMLAKSSVGVVAYTSIGDPRYNSEEAVRLNFERVGLARPINGKLTFFSSPSNSLALRILRPGRCDPAVQSDRCNITHERARVRPHPPRGGAALV